MVGVLAFAESIKLTPQEALSGIWGSISIASWIFLLVPQLIENYKQGSADAISLAFLLVWFLGDITNLAGAVWSGLVPTVIALAVYFCFADFTLIGQVLYYRVLSARRASKARKLSTRSARTDASEEEPLLNRRNSRGSDNIGLPGSHRRKSSAASRRHRESVNRRDSLASIIEEESGGREWLTNILSILGVCVVGTVGWAAAWRTGAWSPTPTDESATPVQMALGAQILGYVSAVCYLGARIPQIIKNWQDQSCEGLSLLFFMLSCMGNITYGASILFHSLEKEYLLTNLPWLVGSLGTVVEDSIIFLQFRLYGDNPGPAVE